MEKLALALSQWSGTEPLVGQLPYMPCERAARAALAALEGEGRRVARFEITIEGACSHVDRSRCELDVFEDPEGEWVRFSDVQALLPVAQENPESEAG